jgi:hypothetical protein
MNGSNTKLPLHGRNEGRALEKSASERLQRSCELRFASWKLVMQPKDAHVFLAGTLLGLDEAGGTVETHDQAARNFGIQRTAVASFLYSERY